MVKWNNMKNKDAVRLGRKGGRATSKNDPDRKHYRKLAENMNRKIREKKDLLVDFLEESNAIEGVYDDDSFKQAVYAWEYLKKQKEMSIGVVLKAHKILMLHHLVGMDKGYFRRVPVWIGGREGIKSSFIREAMEPWCLNAWLRPEDWKRHHIKFEHIHPFIDGNGRLGRLLMNWARVKKGLPVLVIKESEKQDYYKWFK